MRVHGESQALPVLEEDRLTDTQGFQEVEALTFLSLSLFLRQSRSFFSLENEKRPQIVTLKGAQSQRHEGSSNEDAEIISSLSNCRN